MGHVVDSLDILLYCFLLILTILTAWAFKHKRIRFLHESGLAVIYGLLIGFILRQFGSNTVSSTINVVPSSLSAYNSYKDNPPDNIFLALNGTSDRYVYKFDYRYISNDERELILGGDDDEILQRATFNPEIFFYILLPPIIFHAGYSMRKKHFFENMTAILTFALCGTVISTFVIGALIYTLVVVIGNIESLKFLDALYFGAIVSATDPVTVLAIFNDLQVDTMLHGLVLGESLLNDAVAIVLVGAIEKYSLISQNNGELFEIDALFTTLLDFFRIFVGSIILGALSGALTALVTKFTRLKEYPLLETSLFSLMSYGSYLMAEVSGLSGIVSVLFCGIFQAHYTFHNLSEESKRRSKQLFETLTFLTENFIFCYIGVSLFTFTRHRFDILFIIVAFISIALGRALNIYPLSALLNINSKKSIPFKFQHVMWFAGLRGAMAFALSVRNTAGDIRQIFFTTTCLITIVSVIFCGGFTTSVLTVLHIPVGVSNNRGDNNLDGDSNSEESELENWENHSWFTKKWKQFDYGFMKPLLTLSPVEGENGCFKFFSGENQAIESVGAANDIIQELRTQDDDRSRLEP
ncbi:sodium/hydrogen exchanger 6 [Lepeophtheirus salmonis]|uniref:Sodium/hydrogen exchanger n=1 Tax=Lepeophtheirus salmonis TaxID=72036 RepID=A0A0K2SWF0_LEPSM